MDTNGYFSWGKAITARKQTKSSSEVYSAWINSLFHFTMLFQHQGDV
jgi:hypothetical protein